MGDGPRGCVDFGWYEKLLKRMLLESRRYTYPEALIPILPAGAVRFAHRFRPYVRGGLRYRGRFRGDVGRCESGV